MDLLECGEYDAAVKLFGAARELVLNTIGAQSQLAATAPSWTGPTGPPATRSPPGA